MKATGARPTRRRDIRATRKQMAWAEEESLRVESQAPHVEPAPAPKAAEPRARPSVATQVRESVRAIEAANAARPKIVGADGLTGAHLRAGFTAAPKVTATASAAHALGNPSGDGFGVRTLTRASASRDRVLAPYPAGGAHHLALSASEWRAARRAAGDGPVSGFVRRAVLTAAGVTPARRPRAMAQAVSARRQVMFRLSRAERAAIDAARRDRNLTAWMRDAVRAAAAMRSAWTTCADAVLTKGFRRWTLADLERALPGHSPAAMDAHACVLGLSRALSDDRVSIHRGAARAGYDDKTYKRMLLDAGVEVAPVATAKNGAGKRRLVVRLADASRAVRERLATETLSEAARRLGCPAMTLHREVLRENPDLMTFGRAWHLPSATYDAAVARIAARREAAQALAERDGIAMLHAYAIVSGAYARRVA